MGECQQVRSPSGFITFLHTLAGGPTLLPQTGVLRQTGNLSNRQISLQTDRKHGNLTDRQLDLQTDS